MAATTMPQVVDDRSLRSMMRDATKDLHTVAHNLFELKLIKKKMSKDVYKVYVTALYYLYAALEEEIERHKDNIHIAPIYFEELKRGSGIEQDMVYFFGNDWKQQITCPKSVHEYVTHLRKLGAERPELLVAHSYVRYFGDMSGGKVIGKIIKRFYNLPDDGQGFAFYDFSNIANVKSFETLYSSRLEEIPLTNALRKDMVEESILSFNYNINMLQEIVDIAEQMPGGYTAETTPESTTDSMLQNETWTNVFTRTSDVFTRTSVMVIASSTAMMLLCPWFRKSVVSILH